MMYLSSIFLVIISSGICWGQVDPQYGTTIKDGNTITNDLITSITTTPSWTNFTIYATEGSNNILATMKDGKVSILGSCEEIVKVVFTSLQQQNTYAMQGYQQQQQLIEAYKKQIENYKTAFEIQKKLADLYKKQFEIMVDGNCKIYRNLGGKDTNTLSHCK